MIRYFTLGMFIFTLFLGSSKTSVSQSVEDDNSLLWYVINNESEADTSYLFGTIHLLRAEGFEVAPKVKNALLNCDVLMTEMDLSQMGAMLQMASQLALTDGQTLRSFVDSADYALLDAFLQERLGMNMEMYNHQKPMVLLSSVLHIFVGGQMASYDLALTLLATEWGKKLKGLETVAEQIEVLDKVPHEEFMQSIVEMVVDSDKSQSDINELLAAYHAEDLNKISEMVMAYEAPGVQRDVFLIDRNLKWVDPIKAALKENRTFIGVGAAHLGGPQGLIELLQKEGYIVKPVTDD